MRRRKKIMSFPVYRKRAFFPYGEEYMEEEGLDSKYLKENVNYREAESEGRSCCYCNWYMSENGSCALVGGHILPYSTCPRKFLYEELLNP